MDVMMLSLPEVYLSGTEVMESKGLVGGGGVGVLTGKVEISLSQSSRKTLWPSVAAGLRENVLASNASEPNIWSLTSDAECLLSNQASGFLGTNPLEDFDLDTGKSSLSHVTDGMPKHRRSGKVGRSNNGSSRRTRIVQMEVSMNGAGVEDLNGKPQISRQKSITNGKQRDKRNGRLSKSRGDPFSLKNGVVSFSSAAGGGNLLAYGCKSNNFDVTDHVEELSLEELLDGSYTYHSTLKDKGKAVPNSDDSLLNSVRKACSVLRIQSPVHTQSTTESHDQQVSSCPITDSASLESKTDEGSGVCCTEDQPSIEKISVQDSSGRANALTTFDDNPLYEPKDILQLLMLPPPKELDTLLLDAVKPASSSKTNNDFRLGKTVCHRAGLPPFPWSLNPSGKAGPDAVKLAANRPSCQARWAKVNKSQISPKDSSTGFLVDFESLTFDHRLVPVVNRQSEPLEKENDERYISSEGVVSSSATSPVSRVPLAKHSSGAWDAAETLYQIASRSLNEGTHDIVEELEKPQKPLNASKLKRHDKSGKVVAVPTPLTVTGSLLKRPGSASPSKRLKLSVEGRPESVRFTKLETRPPLSWSAPRSIRSSTGKLLRDSTPHAKHLFNSIVKKPYLMPPPSSIMDKATGSQLKLKETL